MISIQINTDLNFTHIRMIALEVWPVAYGAILSSEQLEYMLEMMYSVEALREQYEEKGHHFIVAVEDEVPVGFASFEFDYNQLPKTKIHKLYVLSSQQGKGTGRILIDYISEEAKRSNQSSLILNVNKYNKAQYFYAKLGFSIIDEEVIDIGEGYVMDDFIMEMPI
ncbi:GNAT family N-acetyltransferase [Flavobacterium sp.]